MRFFIIAGPNGAGKTSVARPLLEELGISEYVNADQIAKGLSMLHPERMKFSAGRLAIQRIQDLLSQKVDFAFETTLASKSIIRVIKQAKEIGYETTVNFYSLPQVETSIRRVRHRVELGGHDVPVPTIQRRFYRGLHNFFNLYQPVVDYWFFYSNLDEADLLAYKVGDPTILDDRFYQFNKYYNEQETDY